MGTLLRQYLLSSLLLSSLVSCDLPDTDISDQLPAPVDVAQAVLVPTDDGILVFPLQEDGTLGAVAGFLGDPDDISDIAQRDDGLLVCTLDDDTFNLPEGFVLEADGDIALRADGFLAQLDDTPTLTQPRAVAGLPDGSIVVVDGAANGAVYRFDAQGRAEGLFTSQLSFVQPSDVFVFGQEVIVLDPLQDPKFFRFGFDGSFLGGLGDAATLVVSPTAASAAEGRLFVLDDASNEVVALDASGNLLAFSTSGLGDAFDVAALPNGGVVVVDRGNEEIGIGGGLRVFGAAGNIVQQVPLFAVEGIERPRVAFARDVVAHPVLFP
jgi:hypothetical protein